MKSFFTFCAAFLGVLLVIFIIAKIRPDGDGISALSTETAHELYNDIDMLNGDFQFTLDDMSIYEEFEYSESVEMAETSIYVFIEGESESSYAEASAGLDTLEAYIETLQSKFSEVRDTLEKLEKLQDSYADLESEYFR